VTREQKRNFLVAGAMLLLVHLAGCGNAIDDLKVGDWQAVGSPQSPEPRLRGSAVLTPITLGTGPAVQPGDLVKLKITVFRRATPMVRNKNRVWVENTAEPIKLSDVPVVWLWVGREPGKRDYENLESWGNLGSARVRQALIGRAVGDRFTLEESADAEGFMDIPLRGFSIMGLTSHSIGDQQNQWPSLKIAERAVKVKDRPGKGAAFAEVEILDVCHGRLYQRTAEMTQWGIVPNWGEMNYNISRKGTLRWSAVEGECPSSRERVRFEIGPLYFSQGRPALYNWQGSYQQKRPPTKFPHEYQQMQHAKERAMREARCVANPAECTR